MTKNKIVYILCGFVFVGGFFIGRAFTGAGGSSSAVIGNDDSQQKYEKLKSKLDQLHKVDIEDYFKLKEQKERYEKADEILGKILLIFLADLGLKISPEQQKLAEQMASGASDDMILDGKAPSNAQTDVSGATSKSSNPTPPSHEKSATLQTKEKALDDVSSPEQAKKFLEQVALNDLYDVMKSTKPLNTTQVQTLNGTFMGKIIFEEKGTDPWDVEITFEGSIKESKPSGYVDIKMFKPGQHEPFSHSSGEGDFKDFNSLGDSQAIFVNLQGGKGMFQLYAPKKLNALVGNYYTKEGAGSFKKTGMVTLQKR